MMNASIMESMDCFDQNSELKMFGSTKKAFGDLCFVPQDVQIREGMTKLTVGSKRSYYRFPKDHKQASD